MRTTLTIDEDIAAKLKSEVQKRGLPFKQIVNETLRRGLVAEREARTAGKFRVKARNLGLRPGLEYDNIGDLIEQIEGPHHR
jgi:hypothetical protein